MIHRKHYVIFRSPGTFISEVSQCEIPSWDTAMAVEMAKGITERHGAKPYVFTFETRLVSDLISDGQGGTLNVEPKTVERSRRHFIAGEVETIDQVEARNDPKEETLRWNMRANRYALIVVTRTSYIHRTFFGDTDCIVDAKGNVLDEANSAKWQAYRATRFPAEAQS